MAKKTIDLKNLKVAIVAEELTQLGGAERVLDAFMEIFPKAPIYTLVYDKKKTNGKYEKFDVRPSFIQKMPGGVKNYKWYLPFMPWAVESFNLKNYDLVLSSASALIKGVKTTKNQLHICYCHTPTRYLWSDVVDYLKNAPIPFFVRPLMPLVVAILRRWDLKASKRPDFYIANAVNIAKKIKKYYNRESTVINPPVELQNFYLSDKKEDYFLIVSRIEPYKKVDLVVEAFNSLSHLKLKVVGSGSKLTQISQAAAKNIEFTGYVSDEQKAELLSKAKAFIFPQEEDFGIVALEAMASGIPVIAYRKGGALEMVIEGKTGEFFYPQSAKALIYTLNHFNDKKYDSRSIRNYAKTYDKEVFKKRILSYIIDKLSK